MSEEQDEAFNLLSGHAPVMGKSRAESLERARVEADALPRQGLSGQAGEIASIILVTGYEAARLMVLSDLDEGIVIAQGFGLNEEEGLGIERPGEVTLQGLRRRPIGATPR